MNNSSSGQRYEKKNELREAKQKAMYLWGLNSHTYRTIKADYEALLEEKKEINKNGTKIPLNAISKKTLEDDFVDIEFLRLNDSRKAEKYLDDMELLEVNVLIHNIEEFMSSWLINTLNAKIVDYKKQIKEYYSKKSSYKCMPNPSTSQARCRRTCPGD